MIFSDKALACLDAANQTKILKAARTDTVGIKTAFQYFALTLCGGALAIAGSTAIHSALYGSLSVDYGSAIATLVTTGGLGIYVGKKNYNIDKRNFANTLLPAVALILDISRVEALKLIKEQDPKYIAAIGTFLADEPAAYLHAPETIKKYNNNLKKLADFHQEPTRKSVKLLNGTRVTQDGLVL